MQAADSQHESVEDYEGPFFANRKTMEQSMENEFIAATHAPWTAYARLEHKCL